MKYVEAERIKSEIDKIINNLKTNCNPNPFGTMDECLVAADIEAMEFVKDIIDKMKPSKRGELEITDVNNEYVRRGQMTAFIMKDEEFWSDAGTFSSYAYVNEFKNKERR